MQLYTLQILQKYAKEIHQNVSSGWLCMVDQHFLTHSSPMCTKFIKNVHFVHFVNFQSTFISKAVYLY